MTWKAIMHIPHASRVIPAEYRDQFVLDETALDLEQLRMTDACTDDLFGGLEGCEDLVFPVSRLVVDPERFEHDADEPMAEVGMGAVYELMSQLQPLRRLIDGAERERLMASFYRPHHDRLVELAQPPRSKAPGVRAPRGGTLIIDAHSFPSRALPYERDHTAARPEICIGTDHNHTPDHLRDMAVSLFTKAGFDVAVNTPFAGALVPAKFYQRDMRVKALMIEVRRDLYMDEATGKKLPGYSDFRRRLREVLTDLVQLYRTRDDRLAARYQPDNELRQTVVDRLQSEWVKIRLRQIEEQE